MRTQTHSSCFMMATTYIHHNRALLGGVAIDRSWGVLSSCFCDEISEHIGFPGKPKSKCKWKLGNGKSYCFIRNRYVQACVLWCLTSFFKNDGQAHYKNVFLLVDKTAYLLNQEYAPKRYFSYSQTNFADYVQYFIGSTVHANLYTRITFHVLVEALEGECDFQVLYITQA